MRTISPFARQTSILRFLHVLLLVALLSVQLPLTATQAAPLPAPRQQVVTEDSPNPTLVNLSTASGDDNDDDPVNSATVDATSSLTATLPLQLVLDADRTILIPDETAILTVTVQSESGLTAKKASVTLRLPNGVATVDTGDKKVRWSLPVLAIGATWTQTVQVRIIKPKATLKRGVGRALVTVEATGYYPLENELWVGFAPAAPTTTAVQEEEGALLGSTDGDIVVLAEADVLNPGARFQYSEVYNWETITATTPPSTTTGILTTTVTLTSTVIPTSTVAPTATVAATMTTIVTATGTGRMSLPMLDFTAAPTASNPLMTYAVLLPLAVHDGNLQATPQVTLTLSNEDSGANTPTAEAVMTATIDTIDTGTVVTETIVSAARKPTARRDHNLTAYRIWRLEAQQDGQDVHELNQEVLVQVSIKKLLKRGLDPASLALWTREGESGRWTPVPTTYNARRGLLQAWLPHFSQFGLGAGLSQRGDILPSVVGFTTDRLTGAVSLQYPLEMPAGVGGLKPALSFVYSSLSADDLFLDSGGEYLAQTSGVGLGWSVAGSNNFIVRTDGKLDNNTADILKTFSLVLNGMRVNIRFEENEWRTDPETFYKILWPGTTSNNVEDWSGWTLLAPDGTKYEFGDNNAFGGDADSISTSPTVTYLQTSSGGTIYRLANQWYLRRITDPLGNQVDYKYQTEKSKITTNDCMSTVPTLNRWYTSAVYPTEILWNSNSTQGLGAGLRALFTYTTTVRSDADIRYAETNDCNEVKFATKDWLQSVKVQAWVSGVWVTQRTYQLDSSYGFTWGAQPYNYTERDSDNNAKRTSVKRLLLHGLNVLGKDNGLLQRYAFTYQKQSNNNPNQIHLVTADNGWGGKVTYTLAPHRVACPSRICGPVGRRDTRFAVIKTRVEDGLNNSLYTDYYYGEQTAASGSELGHIGYEDESAQFFGFQRSQATYYAAVSGTTTPSTVIKWDAQDSWPPNQSDTGRADPRAGKPKRLETRLNNGGTIVSVTNYKWEAYWRSNGVWTNTTTNQAVVNNQYTYPSIWVRQEREDTWTAGGSWSNGTYVLNDKGSGQQTKTFYDNTSTFRGYGNVTTVEEYAQANYYIALADWDTAVSNGTLPLLRKTNTEYYPNTTAYIVNQPARIRVYEAGVTCRSETRLTYLDFGAAAHNLYGNYALSPKSTLVARQEQARTACADSNPSPYDTEASFYSDDWVKAWTVTWMDYDSYGNQTKVRTSGNSPSQDLILNTSYDLTYHLFPLSQDLNGSTTYKETATYYGVNEISGHAGVAIWGAMQEHCGVNEVCTRQTYDQFGRRVRRWEGIGKSNSWGLADNDALVQWGYNAYGSGQSATTITEWRNPRSEGNFVRKVYNGLGQLVQEQTPYHNWSTASGAQEIMVDYLYDALGNQIRVSTPWLTNKYSGGDLRRSANWDSYTRRDYDARGLVYQTAAPNGELEQYNYEGRAYSLIGLGRNGEGNKVLKWEERDGLGNLKSVRTYNPNSTAWVLEGEVKLQHTATGDLTQVTHPGGIGATAISYDLNGHKLSMTDPDLGSWSYAYNRQGKLIRQTDARSKTICLYYDSLARLVGKHFRNDTSCPTSPSYNVSYGYDSNHGPTNRSRGQLTSVSYTNGNYRKSLTYEARGLLALETVTIAGAPQSYNTYYAADPYLRPVTVIYPDGEYITTSYNSMGLPSSLSSSSASGTLVDSVSYDEASRLTKLRFPAGGNLWRTQTYWPWTGSNNNSNGRLNTIKVGTSDGSGERLSLTYGYDSFGNIGGLTEQYGSARADKLFCYDSQNRLLRGYDAYNLTAPYVQNCATGNSSGRTYSYDSAGRLTAYENAALTMNTTFPVHTVKNSGYTYDANGNLKTRGGYTLEWDEENHLSAVKNGSTSIESYLYDADGMRVKKSGGNAATYYINAFYEVTIDIPPTPTPTPPPTATPTRTPTPMPAPTRNCRQVFCTPTPPGSASLVGRSADLASAATPMPGTPMPAVAGVTTQADTPVVASAINATTATKYYYFNGQRIAMKKGDVLSYLHSDHLGSTVLETGNTGAMTADQQYYAYGRQRDTGPVITDHKFTGQKQDATGLLYYGARYYDPEIGQFISPDTIVPDPSQLLDYNRYMYARGNPMRYNDPSGHCGASVLTGGNAASATLDIVCLEILAEAAGATVAVTGGTAAPIAFLAAGAYIYENSTLELPTVAPLQPEVLSDDGFTVSIPLPGSTTVTSPQVVTSTTSNDSAGMGSANGERAGKDFTKAGKQTVIERNKAANAGVTRCEKCGVITIPAQKSQSGIVPPANETQVDHMIPKSYGGDGSPSNGEVLCRTCNLRKSNNLQ